MPPENVRPPKQNQRDPRIVVMEIQMKQVLTLTGVSMRLSK